RVDRAFEVRGVWRADDARSAAAWLTRATRAPKWECGARLRLGRAIEELPVAAQAWSAGEIGAAQVRRLAGARNERTADQLREDQAVLVGFGERLVFGDFCQTVDYWFQHADPDGADEGDIDRRDRRRVSLDETFTGMYSGQMLLDPISGRIVAAELGCRERE